MKLLSSLLLIPSILFGSLTLKGQNDSGFGTRQTQGILKGIFLGGALGGAIGNQKNKSVEGILIGSTIGAMIGSKTGKNQDYRRNQEKESNLWKKQSGLRNLQWQRETHERENRVLSQHNVTYSNHIANDPYNDPEVIDARHRAERAEKELKRVEDARRRDAQKKQMLAEYQRREREATQKLFRKH